MTLRQLWLEFGDKFADAEIVFSLNGEEMVPARGAIDYYVDDWGKSVLYLTNAEGACHLGKLQSYMKGE